MKKTILLIFSLCTALMLHAITVNSTAGGLSTAITNAGGDLSTITSLTVTGVIDARDFVTIRDNMPVLSSVDLSGVTIAAYYSYAANQIPTAAFSYYSKITSITIPSSVTSIGERAFNCSGLTSITIPSSVTSIGDQAFSGCSGLITVDVNNPNYSSIDGVLFDKNQTKLIQCPLSKSGNYIIPTSVTSIGGYAFSDCMGITSITIPSSITSIGDLAFYHCAGLTSITIPSSVTSIGDLAFALCDVTSISIPSSVTSIGESAFYVCADLITVDVNNPNYSSIDGVLFDKNQTKLMQCPLSKSGSYIIPSSVTSIGYCAFTNCSDLISITIPSSVTSIGELAFANCLRIKSITIPSSVTSIGERAFNYSGLTSITIPSSVTSIGEGAFSGCESLTSIYSYRTTPVSLNYSDYVFEDVNTTTCILYVPTNSVDLYKAANQWQDFVNIVEMEESGVSTETVDLVSIYPNPATDGFYVNGLDAISTLSIIDLKGKTLLTQQVTANDYISINSLPTGMYVVKISTEAGMIEKKLIKE